MCTYPPKVLRLLSGWCRLIKKVGARVEIPHHHFGLTPLILVICDHCGILKLKIGLKEMRFSRVSVEMVY